MESEVKTQTAAKIILGRILNRKLHKTYDECTGDADTCPIEECMLCGVRDCPGDEPLHYHHDGCPYCYRKMWESEVKIPEPKCTCDKSKEACKLHGIAASNARENEFLREVYSGKKKWSRR